MQNFLSHERKTPVKLLPQGFCKAFFKSVDQAATTERRDNPLSLPSFLSCERKNPVKLLPQGFCKAFFKSVDQAATAERRDSSFSLPSFLFCKRKRASRDCCGALGSSIKLLRLRSRGECLWHSFRSLAAYCSSSAHPRDICRIGFARMVLLAKFIRMRTARSAATASHPCVERPTEGINQYREQSLFQSIKQLIQ